MVGHRQLERHRLARRHLVVRRDRSRPSRRRPAARPGGFASRHVGGRVAPVDARSPSARSATFATSASRVSSMNALAWRTSSSRLPGCTWATKSRANWIGKSSCEVLVRIAAALAQLAALLLGQVVPHASRRAARRRCARAFERLRERSRSLMPSGVDREVHLERVDRHRVELDVRRHADALDRDVARLGEVLRDRELERRLVRQVGEDELHAALAERRARR